LKHVLLRRLAFPRGVTHFASVAAMSSSPPFDSSGFGGEDIRQLTDYIKLGHYLPAHKVDLLRNDKLTC
jgi:hypothetical protein